MISVIIPVYNCEKYVERCVTSILQQNCDALEIVLVDDGSKDNSLEVCNLMKQNYPDTVRVIHKDNGGVSSARNAGMEAAKGDYFLFVDSDDVVPEGALKTLLELTVKEAQLYMGEVWIYGTKRQILYTKKESYTKEELVYEIMTEAPAELLASGVWGKLFSAAIIRDNGIRFDVQYQNGEDGLFFAEYIKYVRNVEVAVGKLPVYQLIRYDKGDRESAVSYFYPDLIKFFVTHRKLLYGQICENEAVDIKNVHQHYINDIIVLMVRAFAFPEFWEKNVLRSEIKKILDEEMVKTAIKDYKRQVRGTSIMIPFCIRVKCLLGLEKELVKRGKKYRINRCDKEKTKSIFRY